jgi:predicted acyltransferase
MSERVESGVSPAPDQRIASIDQLRGYAIFGMIFVNYLGNFGVMPEAFKHHRALADWPWFGFSYADTIAPLFLFVVGMGFRLSFTRRVEKVGLAAARKAAVVRYATLILVGYVIYGYEFQWMWDALVDIGFAGLLAIPFIRASTKVRLIAAVGYLVLYQFIYMSPQFWSLWTSVLNVLPAMGEWVRWPAMMEFETFGDWIMKKSINGGPFGPLSWVFCLLLGSVAYDLLATHDRRKIVVGCLAWGIGLFVLGWVLRLSWPGMKEAWYHSQYGMTAPYPLASTGLCFLTLFFFYCCSDVKGFQFPGLSVLGQNALTIYCVQLVMLDLGGTFVPEDSGVVVALLGFSGFMLFCYGVAWRLHKDRIIIRL